jgi:hypothetical protein
MPTTCGTCESRLSHTADRFAVFGVVHSASGEDITGPRSTAALPLVLRV